ncbi:MAG: hypothetical protein O3A36_02240 [bacterium]|nr:hypothetical protein [bacterium]
MSINFANLTQKQIILGIISILVVCILLVLLGNMYGGFLKSQVAPFSSDYSANGSIKSNAVQDTGAYTLKFQGQNATGAQVEASTVFEVQQ